MHRMLILVMVISLTSFCHDVWGQKDSTKAVKAIEKKFEKNLDDLIHQWYVKNFVSDTASGTDSGVDSTAREYPDSLYIKRIKSMPSAIDLTYNQVVRNFIHVYTHKRRDRVEVMLGLADYYFPVFERILDEHDLPLELKYLAIIESALNPRAVSQAGATGLWQFMYSTGRVYGLTINSFVDERRDPIKSTYAAARYLKDLYNIFGTWDLAIAAYNCGPGNVSKAIHRAGTREDFWEIYYHLPYETRGYFPAFVAAMYVMNYHQQHNLYPRKVQIPYATDTVHVTRQLHLKQVCQVLNMPLKQLQDLNPQYRRNIIPSLDQTLSLELPLDKIGHFLRMEDSIYAYKDSVFFPKDIVKNPGRSSFVHQTPSGKDKLHYKVKPGDNLGYIAEWYNVRASDLRYWNNIRGNMIRVGQTLVVYVPEDKTDYYKKVNSMSFAQKQRRIGSPVKDDQPDRTKPENDDYIYYKVKRGDTLWDIARKYPGVSQNDILRINDLRNARKIQVGQYLKIKKKT
ncbi:MAG TPA: transglycosylase SLT domain-containing protein [Bacteroidales bacterium]|nr:transglycosylase SLT domain-containing protein [Bacteroidales bacterium]